MLKKLFGGTSLLMIGVLILTNLLGINSSAAPFFNSITPVNGPEAGGTSVTINASGLQDFDEISISIPNSTGSTIASQGFHFRIDTSTLGPSSADCRDDINFYDDTGFSLEVINQGFCGSPEMLYVVQVPNIPVGGKTITLRSGPTVNGFSYKAPGSANYPFYRSWLDSDTTNNEANHYGIDISGDSDGNIYVLYSRQAAPISSILIYTLVKFDPDTGNRIWTREMRRTSTGTGGHQIRMHNFQIDGNDNIVIPGRFFQQGILEFEDTVGFQQIDNQVNLHPGFAVIYDKDGAIVNLNTNLFTSSSSDTDEVELDSSGNIYVSAYSAPQDYITKLNPTGDTVLWSVPINPAGSSEYETMLAHSDGFIYAASDTLVKKLDPVDGSEVWAKTYTGTNFGFTGMTENADGTILINGHGISSGPYTVSVDALSETSTVPLGIRDSFFTTIDQLGAVSDITFLGREFGNQDDNEAEQIRDSVGNVYSAGGDKFSQLGQYQGRLHGYVEDATGSWFDADDSFVTTIGGNNDTRGLSIEELDTGGLDTDRYRYTVRFPMVPPSQSAPVSMTSYATFDGTPCTNVVVIDAFSMTCDTPAHASGPVDVEAVNPGQTSVPSAIGTDAYTYDFSGTVISPTNYGSSDCTPDPSTIGVDVVTCLIDLSGDVGNSFGLPASGITGNLSGLGAGDPCTIINNGTPTAQLSCTNIPTTGGTPGSIDAETDDTVTTTVVDNIELINPPTVISPANYGSSDCTPDPSTISVDTVTCLVDLTGDSANNYDLPSSGITANLIGLGAGDPCTIINNGTPTAQLSCTNIPTTGGTPGSIDAETDDTVTTTVVDNIELVTAAVDSDNDGVNDSQEITDGTDPTNPADYQDSDNDGVPDEVETNQGTDPFNSSDFLDDDNGGLPNYIEDTLIPNLTGNTLDIGNDGDDSDPDNDGISAAVEQSGPNSGDGNNDGVPDYIQTNVASAPNPLNDNNYLTMVASGCGDINNLSFIQESDNATQDDDFDYPYGLHRFEIQCTTPGSTATVKFYWDKAYDTTDWVYRKYDNNGYFNFPDVVIGQESINGNLVTTSTMTITDGGLFDLDGAVNGTIVDPAGPTLPEESDSLFGDLIRSGGNYTKNFNYLQVASILVFMAAGLTMIISVKLQEK